MEEPLMNTPLVKNDLVALVRLRMRLNLLMIMYSAHKSRADRAKWSYASPDGRTRGTWVWHNVRALRAYRRHQKLITAILTGGER
jgi:hypothetical protein